ncbi:MAG: radical SAM protein [Myxococcales bacterium]|nr:radical SAM protein [Myxococcales bacterium]
MELRIGLIVAPAFGERGSFVPLGLAYLNGALRQANYNPTFFDISSLVRSQAESLYAQLVSIGFSPDEGGFFGPHLPLLAELGTPPDTSITPLAQNIRQWAENAATAIGALDLALLTLWDSNLYFALALGRVLKQRGITVVMGGPGAHLPQVRALLLSLGGADLILQGEGERRVVELADAVSAGKPFPFVAGAAYLTYGPNGTVDVVETEAPPPLVIGDLPWPNFEQFGADQWVPVLSSRGCIRNCSFCTEKSFWKRYRVRRVDDVLDEIEHHIRTLDTDRFEMNDDLLNGNPRWLHRFCAGIKDRRLNIRWTCFMEPYRLTHTLLDEVAAAGCVLIKYGVQHFDPEMLRLMGRGDEVTSVTDTLRYTASLGIRVHFDLVPGHPQETEHHHATNLRVLPEILDDHELLQVNINPFLLLYGSVVEQEPERFGVQITRWDTQSLSQLLQTQSDPIHRLAPKFIRFYDQVPDRETVKHRTRQLEDVVRRCRARSSYVIVSRDHGFSSIGIDERSIPKHWVWEVHPEDTPRQLLDQIVHAKAGGAERAMVRTPGPPFHHESFASRAVAAGLSGVMLYGEPLSMPFRQAFIQLRHHRIPTFLVERVWSGNQATLPGRVAAAVDLGISRIALDLQPWLSETDGPALHDVVTLVRSLLGVTEHHEVRWAISGLPYCWLSDRVDVLAAHPPIVERDVAAQPITQLPVCRFCSLSNRCPGAPHAALMRLGPDLLVPQPGRPEGGVESDALGRLFN